MVTTSRVDEMLLVMVHARDVISPVGKSPLLSSTSRPVTIGRMVGLFVKAMAAWESGRRGSQTSCIGVAAWGGFSRFWSTHYGG